MMRARLLYTAIVAALGQIACASGQTPAVTDGSSPGRFGPVENLVLADSAELKPAESLHFPRFPPDMKAAGTEAAFAAFFVVDTAGRVEYPTVSFTSGAARPFREAVCSVLRTTRYAPIVRDGIPRRALVISPWTFALEGGAWYNRRYDPEPVRRAIVAEGIPNAVVRLEAQPHC